MADARRGQQAGDARPDLTGAMHPDDGPLPADQDVRAAIPVAVRQ
jgi:hypothetical protein